MPHTVAPTASTSLGLSDLYPALWRAAGEPEPQRHVRHVEYWEAYWAQGRA
ncbi:MAG: hypothetical protein M3O70_17105 [Actinomycetota bacterium]|nr:hypothetical protein [Actinomycetota bacterium]